jgi:hypothetical protein
MNELDRQNILRGKLMAALLAKGVRRQDLSSEDFLDASQPDSDDLFVDMVTWLRDEGFVRYDSLYSGTNGETVVADICPTSLAMSLLDQKVDGQMTGRDVVQASADGDASWWGKFGSFVGGFVGGLSQSVA